MSDDSTIPRTTPGSTGDDRAPVAAPAARTLLALVRISIGWIFLWAFLDKLLGLGRSTPAEGAWLTGGSPTEGYLASVEGPFAPVFNAMSGAAWADVLFMLGLGAIGLSLVLGVGERIAAATGALLLMFMYAASLPLETNPFMDDYIVQSLALGALACARSGETLGLGRWWASTGLVRRFPVLR
ncbi:hypothetical protein IDM40_23805 [Nocardiopsis sp. HNM0947]|uniref:Thiosulfate dehydrogenase [quinone] large subunit n=1 Tax=Nocardiopsis coralli TaxID=2772213 RepID=A0ABR9PD06_9ACTN|nr:hypothetical protein [Nocardiopsis coralli]MBE3001697.1 hypothetical protein [Nocardiopsis coralli]